MANDELKKYREWLLQADHQASLNYDKAVMTLAGGALALSMTFLHDIVPLPLENTKGWLQVSWASFALSLTCILVSYLFSMASLRKTMRQVDQDRVLKEHPGGWQARVTVALRYLASGFFVLGVFALFWFVQLNY